MRIGELSCATGTPVETIRFYERKGLLPAPARTAGNYRSYGPAHVDRLAFVRHCRALDMTLDEIRVLLKFRDAPHADCAGVNALLDEHIGHVAARIGALRALQRQLKALREQCRQVRAASQCGILNGLADASLQQLEPPDPSHPPGHVRGAHAPAARQAS